MTVDVIDFRSKNSNITDKNNSHIKQENLDLLTDFKERGIVLIVLIKFISVHNTVDRDYKKLACMFDVCLCIWVSKLNVIQDLKFQVF